MLISRILVATTTRGLLFTCTSSQAYNPSHFGVGAVFNRHPSLPITTPFYRAKDSFSKTNQQQKMQRSSIADSTPSSSSYNSRVALIQFKVTESKTQNIETASTFLEKAANQHVKMAVLPEIWNSPYATSAFPEYAEILPDIGDDLTENLKSPSAKLLMEKAKEYQMYIIGGSIPERVPKSNGQDADLIFNTCLCINPEGKIVGKHRKVHLFDIDVPGKITFKESDTLTPGTSLTAFDAKEPFGMVGVGICYDIRFPELAQCLIDRGCGILIFPGAFNLTTGPAHWELLQRARAVDGQCYVLTASPARSTQPEDTSELKYPHYSAWGHSTAISPWGDVVATCNEDENIVIVDLEMEKVREMRESIPTSLQKRKDLYNLVDLAK